MKAYKQKHRPKFRSGFHQTANRKPYVQAHINFFDNNNGDGEGALKLNKYQTSNTVRQYKWPNLSRLHSQLHEDITEGELPPYIKKYNRRNKQLINLLEGTISPNYSDYHKKLSQRRQKNTNKWLEKYLFEEQRPIKPQSQQHDGTGYVMGKHTQVEPNALPGEYVTVSSDLNDGDDMGGIEKVAASDKAAMKASTEKLSNHTKARKRDRFLFHRVAAPKLVGMGTMDSGTRKQRLPFVAITDKRVGEVKQRLDNTQGNVPMP